MNNRLLRYAAFIFSVNIPAQIQQAQEQDSHIITYEQLESISINNPLVSIIPRPGEHETINDSTVIVGGCFEFFHPTHQEMLKSIKTNEDLTGIIKIIVLLESDQTIESKTAYGEKRHCIQSQDLRAKLIASSGLADEVIMLPDLKSKSTNIYNAYQEVLKKCLQKEAPSITYIAIPNDVITNNTYHIKHAEELQAPILQIDYVKDRASSTEIYSTINRIYCGVTAKGLQVAGKDFGFPTANLYFPNTELEVYGSFAGWARINNSIEKYPATCYLSPDFQEDNRLKFETHIHNYDEKEQGSLYGNQLSVELVHFISPPIVWDQNNKEMFQIMHKKIHEDHAKAEAFFNLIEIPVETFYREEYKKASRQTKTKSKTFCC